MNSPFLWRISNFQLNGNENDNNEGNANSEVMAMNVIMMGGRDLDLPVNLQPDIPVNLSSNVQAHRNATTSDRYRSRGPMLSFPLLCCLVVIEHKYYFSC